MKSFEIPEKDREYLISNGYLQEDYAARNEFDAEMQLAGFMPHKVWEQEFRKHMESAGKILVEVNDLLYWVEDEDGADIEDILGEADEKDIST